MALPDRYTSPVRIDAGVAKVQVQPLAARAAKKATVDGKTVYLSAYPQIDVVHEPNSGSLKESLVVHGPLRRDVRFQLRGAAVPFLRGDGSIGFRVGKRPIGLRSPAPVTIDNGGKRLPAQVARYRLEGRTLILRLALPADASYPVVVDPTFDMGQQADHTIGTTSFAGPAEMGRQTFGLARPASLAGASKLLIGDTWGGSINGFDTPPTSNGADFEFRRSPGFAWMSEGGMWSNDTKLVAADAVGNRVFVYDTFPTSQYVAPAVVLGQTPGGTQANEGGRSLSSIRSPGNVWSDGTRLAVSDSGNHRVLIWNSWPTAHKQAADLVLGQADGTGGDCNRGVGPSASSLCNPQGIWSDGTRLFVADGSNNRVLIWDSWPSGHGQAADRVLGQSSLTANGGNAFGATKASLYRPDGISGGAGRLMIADSYNARVLIYDTLPAGNGQAANVEIGSMGASGLAADRLNGPRDVRPYGTGLAVADHGANRVLIWDNVPSADGAPANRVLGQTDFTHGGYRGNRGDSPMSMGYPAMVAFDAPGRLYVGSFFENVIYRFSASLPANGAVADYAIGTNTPGESSIGGYDSMPVYGAGMDITPAGRLWYATDSWGSGGRVTWHNSMPTSGPSPHLWSNVLGQPDLGSISANRGGGPAANTIYNATDVSSDDTRIAVADCGNARVLIWNSIPTSMGVPADVVVGQQDFSTGQPNQGGVSATSMGCPRGVLLYRGRLYVADSSNNRVLVWNSIPTVNGQPADAVLGQSSMRTSNATTTASGMSFPQDLAADDGMLAVADRDNHRVLIWDTAPTATAQPADRALGQPSLTSAGCAHDRTGLCGPSAIALRNGQLAVNDGNHRIVVYKDVRPPALTGIDHVIAGGRATISWTTDEDASSEIIWDTVSHPTEVGYAFTQGSAGLRRAHSLIAQPLASGTAYYYRVRSVDSRGNLSVSAERSLVTVNTTILQASPAFAADTSLSEAGATSNYGGAQQLTIGGTPGNVWRSLLRFELDQIPSGATISSASLQLTTTDAGAGGTPTIEAYRIGRPFSEGLGSGTVEPDGATWASADGVDPWTTVGGDVSGAAVAASSAPAAVGGVLSLDVTSLLAAWVSGTAVNDGVLLRTSPEPAGETKAFGSAETSNTLARPVLVVQWLGSDVTNPRVGNLRVEMLSSSSARITWDTDEAATTLVDYGTTSSYGSQTRNEQAVNRHSVTLVDLTPNTEYRYRVSGADAQGNVGASTERVFRTSYRAEIVAASDAFLRQDMPARNFGGQPSLFAGNAAGSWQTTRSLLRFDLSSLPLGASVRSSTVKLGLSGQANTSQPPLSLHRLQAPYIQGTGNPLVAPGVIATSGAVNSGPDPLLLGNERHVTLTAAGWWQIVPFPDIWASTYLQGRRNYDGTGFGADTVATSSYSWGKEGTASVLDGDTLWLAGLSDGTPTLQVRSLRASTGAQLGTGGVAFPAGATSAPGLTMASDGRLWAKAENPSSGEIHVRRSTSPRDATAWQASTLLTSQAIPAHAQIVSLASGRMLAISQDGNNVSSFEWDGSTWGAPMLAASDAKVPAEWRSQVSFGAVDDGSGAWLSYLSTTGAVRAARYSGSTWSAPVTVATSATSIAISYDRGNAEPHLFWQDGTALRTSHYAAGAWTMPTALPSTLPASPTQLSASPPSTEALAITWVEPSGGTRSVKWYGYALPKAADGATWDARDGISPWASAGGDADPTPLAIQPAPGAVGATLSFDITTQVTRWLDGLDANDGLLLKKQTEDSSLNDWKAFYGTESSNVGLRPRLVVDYDLATVTISEPNAATAWKTLSTHEVSWQTTGSGMTKVDILSSRDAGATWSTIVADAPNSDAYNWTTPATAGMIRLRVDAKNSLGAVVTSSQSPDFVLDDTPPSPVTDLTATSPSSAPALAWTQPADTGGAGMTNGSYRIYRSTVSGSQGTRIATVGSPSHVDSSPLIDGTYYYTVLPVDAAGNVQPAGNNQFAVVIDRTQPNPVTDLAAPALTRMPVAMSWSPVTDNGTAGMGTYRVYRSSSAGPLGSLLQTVGATTASDTPPMDGTYHYTIAPVDIAGNAKLTGNNQVAVTFDTTAPSGISVMLDAGATWTRDTDVTAALGSGDAVEYQLSSDSTFASSAWAPVVASTPFTLGAGQGNHVVYARFRDAAGNISATVNDSVTLDSIPPDVPSRVDDGSGADRDYTSSTNSLAANWPAAIDATSGIQRYEYCIGTAADASGCVGTVLVAFTSTGLATSANASGLTLTPGTSYTTCVRTFDNAGNPATSVRCSDAITVMSLIGVSPAAGAQDRQGLTVQLTGTGFAPDATASFSGTGITLVSSTRISSTRLDVVIDIAAAAPLSARDVNVTNVEGSSVSALGQFTVEPSYASISTAGCASSSTSFGVVGINTDNVTTADCSVEFGSNNNTAMLTVSQQDGTGTAMAGASTIADYTPGISDWIAGANTFGACLRSIGPGTATDATTWSTTGSCTASNLDPWNPIPTTAAKIARTATADTTNANASMRFGWRTSATQTAGAYSASLTFTVITPNA